MPTVLHDARFSVGQVFSLSFSVFVANFIPFMTLGLLLFLPYAVLLFFFSEIFSGPDGWIGIILLIVVLVVLQVLLQATLIYGTVSQLRGNRRPFIDSLINSIGLVPPVLLIGILLAVGLLCGFLLLVIPGLILLTMWWVTIPVAVVERPGIGRSFSRSAELTKGRRWSILGIFIIVQVGMWLVDVILSTTLLPSGPGTLNDFTGYVIGSWVFSVITAAFQAVLVAVSYTLLRTEKEGTDINQIAAVFD